MPKIHADRGPTYAEDIPAGLDGGVRVPPEVSTPGREQHEREAPATGEVMVAVEGDDLVGDGSGTALPPADESGYPPGAVELDGVLPYKDMTVPQLQAELERRHLPKTGKKPELVARLEASDTATSTSKES